MFRYMKLTDTHLRHDNLAQKLPPLVWARELAIEQGVHVVLHAGDLVDHDNFGGRMTTPGGVVEAYYENFSKPLADQGIPIYIVRGNHDKRAARRGSALWNFMGSGTETIETVERRLHCGDGKLFNIVLAPWIYPEEVIGAKEPEEDPADYHARYIAEVEKLIAAELYVPTPSHIPEANILVAHCRYAGSLIGPGRLCPTGEGMELSRELLARFNDLHLGDIHKRQEILSRGGYTGALTQEGMDEAGNPSGVEIVTIDEDGITRTWHECPCALRFEDRFVEDAAELADQESAPFGTVRRYRYLSDGSERAKAIAEALEPLAKQGARVEPKYQLASRETSPDQPVLETLDRPEVALDHYLEVTGGTPEDERQDLHTELDELLGKKPAEEIA